MKLLASLLMVAGGPSVAAPTPYVDLVSRYAAGERAPAVAELGHWTEKDLERELNRLRSWERRARQCGACEEKHAFARFPLRAAVLLHTDREELERRSRAPVDEATPRCGVGPHGLMAKELTFLVMLGGDETGFVRRWYLAMAWRSQENACMEDGLEWAQGGLKWYPDHPELLLARGTINETTASLSWDAFSATQGSPATTGRPPPDWRVLWLKKARQDFDHALKVDPGLVEARLRRGRVQWLLGEKAEAHASFDAVLASRGEDEVLFTARLFRGRCYEEEKELVRAEADYRAALALDPASQSAAVAASYVTWLQGKAGEPRELLEQALVQSGRRIRPDSYWDYSFGRVARADALLEALREGVRR